MDMSWIVVRAQTNREKWACINIERQGARIYLPKIVELRQRKRQREPVEVIRPLFSGYLFVETDGQWRFLLGTFGVTTVIMNGDRPALLPNHEIDKLRKLENKNGIIELPKQEEMKYEMGQRVKVCAGPFKNHIGVYDGQSVNDREIVLLEMLGRQVPTIVARATIIAA